MYWRPISQLSCLGKIYERIILNRIDKMLANEHPNLFETQFGFRRGISVEHYLNSLQYDIDDGLNKGKCTTIVALDAKAAFDTVWHSGLIFKLKSLNFNNYILKCIASFLFNRTFSVNIGGISSSIHPILSGTPQGSVLSPRLFNLYVSDIPVNNNISIKQFADDTALHVTYKSPLWAQCHLNMYLSQLANYYEKWKLFLNTDKTEMIHIWGMNNDVNPKIRKEIKNLKIKLKNVTLKPSNTIRVLGVYFNSKNRFIQHINIRLDSARKSKFALMKLFKSAYLECKYPHI